MCIRIAIFAILIGCYGGYGFAEESIEPPITEFDRAHWSFFPIERPEVPAVQNAKWSRNPIDRFILAKLEEVGLRPMPKADKVTLMRRVTFDLTGLPPKPEDIEHFLADDRPGAYERLIDRLLASGAYGERWAMHWLDLARFAETDGFEHDHIRPNAWRYRDWVISALNADMPYDEYMRLQLAGDEFHPQQPAAAVATGFLLCGPDMPDINSQDERRHVVLNEMASTVGSVFLGLQIGCAQCHDHKFDPLSQADFYRLRAFFENAELFREHPIPSAQQRLQRERIEAERNRQWVEIESEIDQLYESVLQREREKQNDPKLKLSQKELREHFTEEETKEVGELTAWLGRIKKQQPPPFPMGRVMREISAETEPSYLRIRGDWQRKGAELQPAFLRVVNYEEDTPKVLDAPPQSSGRRMALARWLTQPDHPLTTRVIVNRIWQHHFGRGLSSSPSDFGIMGDEPTHPQLLDWLATELPRRNWSLKSMHRLMVTSAIYQQRSRPDDDREQWETAVSTDPNNKWFSRMNRRRLEGETIRDAMLSATESLSHRRGGPGVRPPLPKELLVTLLKNQWPTTPNVEDHNRRSIYLFVRRNLQYPMFAVFDKPDTNQSCARRNRSTIAPQALTLLNSELSLSLAVELAKVVLDETGGDDAAAIATVYLRTLSRRPTSDEIEMGRAFLKEQAKQLREENRERNSLALPVELSESVDIYRAAALVDFCLVVFNLNEFVYLD